MARTLQGPLGQSYPHRSKQCRDDADVRISVRLPRVTRVAMYHLILSPTQIRIVDAPALCAKEITSKIHGRPLHLHLHLHIPHVRPVLTRGRLS